nr:hypothetical protein [Tanacetum cinerariifolium]
MVFQILRNQRLLAKFSKCAFGVKQIEYLGHVISSKGVATDPQMIKAVAEWPRPKNVKQLRGFLGLTGYYRIFVKDYGSMAKPLTQLLKKESFSWNLEAEQAFLELKKSHGSENKVGDALLRVTNGELLALTLSEAGGDLLKLLQQSWQEDEALKTITGELQQDPTSHPKYSWNNRELRRKNKLVVGNCPLLKNMVLKWMHDSSQGGHSGITATVKRINSLFYWPKVRKESAILVVMDRLSKYGHFIALKHPFSAVDIAQIFLDNIYKLHGFHKSIVSDRDKIFVNIFWKELLSIHGIEQNMSTANHPQSDGQTEVLNRCLEGYLWCMCGTKSNEWSKWLPLAEYWYNTTYHSATLHTPYEVVHGQPPPIHLPYLPGESKVEVVDRSLMARVGTVAYTLKLPDTSTIHPTFHVSLLKLYYGSNPQSIDLPNYPEPSSSPMIPEKVVEVKPIKRQNKVHVEWLIKWKDHALEDATWESAARIMELHPALHLILGDKDPLKEMGFIQV